MLSQSPLLTLAAIIVTLAAGGRAVADPGADNLLAMWRQYTLPRTLHCKVRTSRDFKTIPPGIVHVDGTDEFWADGAKYRIANLNDSSVFFGMSHDVRWDGERFQDFNPAGSLLIISNRPKQKTPYLDQPVPLMPFIFLNSSGDDEGVKTTFDAMRSAATGARLAQARSLNAAGTQIQFPGGIKNGVECSYFLTLGPPPEFSPTRIILRTSSGNELFTMDLSYQPIRCAGGVVQLPNQVQITSRGTDGKTMVVATFTVTEMEADAPIAAETFTIDYQTARRVVDVDLPISQQLHLSAPAPNQVQPAISPGIAVGRDPGTPGPVTLLLALFGVVAAILTMVAAYFRKASDRNEP